MRFFRCLVILFACHAAPAFSCAESCSYFVKDKEGVTDLGHFDGCAFATRDGSYRLFDVHLRALTFDQDGLASLRIGDGHFYVKPNGDLLSVVAHDNWADDFSEGLVRSLVNGKIGYFNDAFEQVIAPRYDWGWPFVNGRALVCKGCSAQLADAHEHWQVTGGLWGYIDSSGNEVVPVIHAKDALPVDPPAR